MNHSRETVALRALRMIGVAASDEPATADQMQAAIQVLNALFAELRAEAVPTWDVATGTPDEAFMPLANWLAAELAGEYMSAAPMTRARAKLRLLAVVRPDDRTDDDCSPCGDYGSGAHIVYVPQSGGGVWDDEGMM